MANWIRPSPSTLVFLAVIIAPTLLTAFYFHGVASDQYHSRVAFVVRSLDSSPASNVLGMLTETSNNGAEDSLLLFDFIQSQQMVEALDADGLFSAIYNDERADPLFTLGREQPVEWKTFFWNILTRVSYNNTSRVIEVETYAFTPQAATDLARRVAVEAEKLVNQISENARRDAVSYAQSNVDAAEDRLRDARLRLAQFRDKIQTASPVDTATTQTQIIAQLETALAAERTNYETLSAYLSADAPSMRNLQRRMRSIQAQIDAERLKLGSGVGASGASITSNVTIFEELTVEREFAENVYTNALTALTEAQGEARRSQRYLAIHIAPTLAQSSIYPSRNIIILSVFLSLFMSVVIVRMVIASTTSRL